MNILEGLTCWQRDGKDFKSGIGRVVKVGNSYEFVLKPNLRPMSTANLTGFNMYCQQAELLMRRLEANVYPE